MGESIVAESMRRFRQAISIFCLLVASSFAVVALAQEKNLNELPNRLRVPAVKEGEPAAGTRVWQKPAEYQEWSVAHALYLPVDWVPGGRYPVIFEYAGRVYRNKLGDTSQGDPDGCQMGFGLSEGKGAIWVCLPFVDRERRQPAQDWWGDADETVRYCKQAVDLICKRWGGDRQRLLLCGFSRGAIATSYIGLRDQEIADLWCGLMAHSHYDGVRAWPYALSDADSAVKRLSRFGSKPQWLSQEVSIEANEAFLRRSGLLHDRIRLVTLPYPNHSAEWLLKDIEEAKQARKWWQELVAR